MVAELAHLRRLCGHPATGANEVRPNWVEFRAQSRKGLLATEKIREIFGNHQPAMTPSQTSRPGARPIPLLKGALGAAVALAALSLSTGSAQAACASGTAASLCRVTVGGLQYDVTTFTGTYNANTIKFETAANSGVMPWWTGNSDTTARAFAAEVGDYFGAVNPPGTLGPLFAYKVNPLNSGSNTAIVKVFGGVVASGNYAKTDPFTYAEATLYTPPAASPAPGPLPLFGAAAAFGFSRQLRKRIQGARLQVSSRQPRA